MEINRSMDAGSLKNQSEGPSSGCGCSRGVASGIVEALASRLGAVASIRSNNCSSASVSGAAGRQFHIRMTCRGL
jgi:hypothetical protein